VYGSRSPQQPLLEKLGFVLKRANPKFKNLYVLMYNGGDRYVKPLLGRCVCIPYCPT